MQKQKGKHANEFDFVGLGADFLTGLTRKISVEPLDQRNHKEVVPIHSMIAKYSKIKRSRYCSPTQLAEELAEECLSKLHENVPMGRVAAATHPYMETLAMSRNERDRSKIMAGQCHAA
jgi:hypothetical protein